MSNPADEVLGRPHESDEVMSKTPHQSRGSSIEQEIYFSNSSSCSSSDDDEASVVQSESVDVLMTEKEIQDCDLRLQKVLDNTQKQKNEHEKWENEIYERRLKVFERLLALGKTHKNRLEIYVKMQEYIQNIKSDLRKKSDAEKV